MLNKFFKIVPLVLILSLTSCINPLKLWTKTEKKVDVAQEKIQANKDKTINAAKEYTYATKLSLDLNDSPNKFTLLAQDFNSKSILTLGTPTIEEVNGLKLMVTSLLSTNAKIIAEGKSQLADLDSKVIYLQNQKVNLESKLDTAEKKLVEVGEYNSGLASTWHKIKSYFLWGFWIFVIVIILKLASQFLPPPYNNIFSIISAPIGLFIRLIQGMMPDVKQYAKVVSEDYKSTVSDLATAIEELKKSHPEIKENVKNILLKNTDSSVSQKIITQTKTELGL